MKNDSLTQSDINQRWSEINFNVISTAKKCNRNVNDITVIAVAKTKPTSFVELALNAGIGNIGENYVQELLEKHNQIDYTKYSPKWHFIGHLQRNKIKYIIDFVSLIHSVDSFQLAQEISKQAENINRNIDILIQVNTSLEDSKFGCSPNDTIKLFEQVSNLKNISIKGLMTIGSFSYDESIIRREFKLLHQKFDEINKEFPELNIHHLSMGMSGDYQIAIEEGATLIRIGTTLFGERNYNL
ncbi:MAG TPA: YggS family pyridoxal phosphate-dependent enzyme [Candidatus Kapabacteria bacterium]|nr:YggS family pyridoxal phosphate-dependent enzyme [Candidatus Kapabacteria bacterium]HPO62258.1 YggS family pyridoxal phosphate-dependent enzyme [Candidatus Kapabacteria bacterium]